VTRADIEAAVEHLRAVDKKLARIIEKVGPCTIQYRRSHSIFESLLRSIIYQQLAGAAASAILERVRTCLPVDGLGYPSPQQILDAPDEVLRAAGLSRNKMAALRDLAAKTLDGTVPTLVQTRRMSNEQLIERLTEVRGVGQWTVEMLLIFRLGRPDVLPVDDYGVRKGVAVTYRMKELPKPKELTKMGEKWRPYRSVASWYFWQIGRASCRERV
jgi:3-methyladenine DNA glycosylase/8-oxoguanine DNA glycosylase